MRKYDAQSSSDKNNYYNSILFLLLFKTSNINTTKEYIYMIVPCNKKIFKILTHFVSGL